MKGRSGERQPGDPGARGALTGVILRLTGRQPDLGGVARHVETVFAATHEPMEAGERANARIREAPGAPMTPTLGRPLARIILPYLLFAGLWILLSDRALDELALDTATHARWSIYKGWTFVLTTALLLALLLQREFRRHERLESDLRSSSARLQKVLEVETVGVMFWDLTTGRMTDANDTFLKSMGYSRADVESGALTWQTLTPPEYVKASLDEIRKFQVTGRVGPYEKEYLRKDGTRQWFVFAGSSLGGNTCVEFCVDISRHKQVEAALRETEARLRLVLDGLGSQMFVGLLDTEGVILAANRPALEAAGLRVEDVLGRPVHETYWFTYSDDVARRFRAAVQRSTQGETVRYDEQIRVAEGRLIWVAFNVQPVRDDSGNVAFIVPSAVVIHERKLAETALRESEARLRLAAAAASVGLWDWDLNTNRVFFSREWKNQIGYRDDEIADDFAEWQSRVHPDDLEPTLDKIRAFIADPQGRHETEFRFRHKDGSYRWIYAHGDVLRDVDGRPTRMLGCHIDITERRRVEDERRQVFDRVSDAFVALDKDWHYTYLNAQAAQMFGRRPEELIGKNIWTEFPEGVGQRFHHAYMQAMAEQEPVYLEGYYPPYERWFENRIYPSPEGLTIYFTDITKRKQAEERVQALHTELRDHAEELEERVAERTRELGVARDRAEAADRIKSAFLATMSHELRTPLNSIIGFTGIVRQGLAGPLNDEQHTQLGMVQTSARHLLALINDVLDLSRIEAGELRVAFEPFDLRELLERVVTSLQPFAASKGLALRSEFAPDLGLAVSDARRVEQILINLLNNAVKFTERGDVSLRAVVTDGRLRVDIADTGMGIQSGHLELIFRPFQQVDTGLTRHHEGTGLGLAICRRLADLLGAEISARSEWGRGSVFTLILPLRPATTVPVREAR